MDLAPDISPLTLNRFSVYLRCLRVLEGEGVEHVSSSELAERFDLSSSQIRKDLAQLGDLGVRGVGYHVARVAEDLHRTLRLDQPHRLLVVGVGNLGSALCSYLGFNDATFRVVAGLDSDPERIGLEIGNIVVRPMDAMESLVAEEEIDIGLLTLPPDATLSAFERLVGCGVRSILNFAAVQLPEREGVRVKNADLRVDLEELAFYG